ncbi:MAG: tryptophan synthase subunit alpha [SAR324 cluster bacterium]|nr:tryptophan synthase subunit alpha [SAR324 cluster bacterium]
MQLTPYIHERLKHKKILLMTHAVVGYPSLEANWSMLEKMQAADVDLVELQMPFSEPMADGPLFVKANQEALAQGITVDAYFSFMREVTRKFSFPVLMMGYYNTVFALGHQQFCQRLEENGAKGYIIADLPLEEYGDLLDHSRACFQNPVLLTTPTNTESRLHEIFSQGQGFVYCVARKGVTGTNTRLDQDVQNFINRCRKHSDLPLALGFGLSEPEDIVMLQGKVEIGIVGTALLKTWEQEGEAGYEKHLRRLAQARL